MSNWKVKALAKQLHDNPDLRIDKATARALAQTSRAEVVPIASEYDLQTEVFTEINRRALIRPEYAWIYAVPNGQYRPGQRLEPGTRSGVPDIAWDLARGGYHGLRIELKFSKNGLQDSQKKWGHWLKTQGYFWICISDSVANVTDTLDWYYHLE